MPGTPRCSAAQESGTAHHRDQRLQGAAQSNACTCGSTTRHKDGKNSAGEVEATGERMTKQTMPRASAAQTAT